MSNVDEIFQRLEKLFKAGEQIEIELWFIAVY